MKWIAVGALVLLATCWLAGGWLSVLLEYTAGSQSWTVQLGGGIVATCHAEFGTVPPPSPDGWHYEWRSKGSQAIGWKLIPAYKDFSIPQARVQIRVLEVPLYIPFALLALPTAFLFYRDYRDRRSVRWAREGRCVGCGYDLSGVSGKCPECGREAA